MIAVTALAAGLGWAVAILMVAFVLVVILGLVVASYAATAGLWRRHRP